MTAQRGRSPSSDAGRGGGARAFTPPKGRPTPKRDAQQRDLTQDASKNWRLQWAVVAILAVVVLVAFVVVFGDGGGGTGPAGPIGGHGG